MLALARLAAAVVLVSCWASPAAAQALQSIEALQAAYDWALDPASGRIFASLGGTKHVAEYDPATGQEVRRFEVGQGPTELLVKGSRLVVAVQGGVSLYSIDLARNEVEGRVALEGSGPSALFCSQADNAYVYAFCNLEDAGSDGDVFQVDLAARKVRKRVPTQDWRRSDVRRADMTADGRWLLVSGYYSPSGASVLEVDEETGAFEQGPDFHNDFGPASVGPGGRFWLLGNQAYPLQLFSLETTKQQRFAFEPPPVRTFSGQQVAAHPSLDLVVGLSEEEGRKFIFQSFGGAEVLVETLLPASKVPQDGFSISQHQHATDEATLVFDVERGRAFYGSGPDAVVCDLAALKVPQTPLVLMQLPPLVTASTAAPLVVPLKLIDEGLLAGTRFALEDAPRGMAIDAERRITWSPGDGDVGVHRAVVTAEAGKSRDRLAFEVRVSRPRIELGAVATHLSVDPAGRRAIVVASQFGNDFHEQLLNPQAADPELLLIDLERGEVTARRALTRGFTSVALTEKAVYLIPGTANVLYALKFEDLSDDRRVFLDRQGATLTPLFPGALAVATTDGPQVYDEETLEVRDDPPYLQRLENWMLEERQSSLVEILQEGISYGGLVLTADGSEVLLLQPNDALPMANPPQSAGPPRPWSRRVDWGGLYGPGETPVAQFNAPASLLLRELPVAVSLQVGGADFVQGIPFAGDPNLLPRVSLQFRNLIEGDLDEPLVLMHEPLDVSSSRPLLAEAAGKLLAACADKLFVLEIPAERFRDYRQPVRIVPRQQPLSAAAGDVVELPFEAVGGVGQKQWTLLADFRGVAVDAHSGTVTVDTGEAWEAFRSAVGTPEGSIGGLDAARAREAYRKIFRQETDRFPVALNLALEVRDEEGAIDRLATQLVVLGPPDDVDQALAAAVAKLAAAREQARPEAGVPPTDPQGPAPVDSQLAAQIAASFQRSGEIGAQVGRLDETVAQLGEELEALRQEISARPQGGEASPAIARIAALDERLAEVRGEVGAFREQLTRMEESGRQQQSSLHTLLLAVVGICLLFAMALFLAMLTGRRRSATEPRL